MKLPTLDTWFSADTADNVNEFILSLCSQSSTCWCTMSSSSCLCGRTGKPSSPSPWTHWRRWVRLITMQRYSRPAWWGMVGADVGYSLSGWLNAAFRLIILSSERAWSCTLMALILTTALSSAGRRHTCTHPREKDTFGGKPPLHFSFCAKCTCSWEPPHMNSLLHEMWPLQVWRL